MTRYPDARQLLAGQDPERLLEVRRALVSILSQMMYFFGALIVVALLNWYWGDFQFSQDMPVLRHFSLRWLFVLPLGLLVEIVRRYQDDLYVFGRDKVTHYNGRLSLSLHVPSIKYADIRGISVFQDIWGRILNYGDIALDTAAQKEVDILICGVAAPDRLALLVEELRANCPECRTAELAGEEGAAE